MQKWPVFHLISKHSLNCIIISMYFYALLMSLRRYIEARWTGLVLPWKKTAVKINKDIDRTQSYVV